MYVLVEDDHARMIRRLGKRGMGIPDRPGVDRALHECRGRIRRRERRGRDVVPGKPRLLKSGDQQIVGARSLAKGDALALEIPQRLDRGILRDNDRLGISFRFDRCDVANPGAAGLSEDRRRIADIAEVDGADIDCLEQRWTELEVDPLDVDAERLECILDRMALPHRWKEATLLRADASFGRLVLCLRGRYRRSCNSQSRTQHMTSCDHGSVLSGLVRAVSNAVAKTGWRIARYRASSSARAARSASRAERNSRLFEAVETRVRRKRS